MILQRSVSINTLTQRNSSEALNNWVKPLRKRQIFKGFSYVLANLVIPALKHFGARIHRHFCSSTSECRFASRCSSTANTPEAFQIAIPASFSHPHYRRFLLKR